ncbi:hypothetical protein TanjilG_30794 [Lupinus angustifolius]|uniref:BHLH domain-containing protein n=1 Tax=Lupinus angustifolius TaxID=3871 RepID=A0A1J7HVE6_LUPAN|nr:PREDICTED: transcription factor bHLH75-like [Lupinus angustifolius]OIW16661.1 hypothetical protein TanjilG_30794 [Lupinus angustifolius]
MPFSSDNFLNQQPKLHTVQTFIQPENQPNPVPLIHSSNFRYDHEEIQTMVVSKSLGNASPPYTTNACAEKNKNLVGNKRKRNNNKAIHVRAKRGQATDSHSLSERVRREKINEKLRYLQDLVPGCYKAMGMAVMLDVIIEYVHSLQQQIEFLSMKLSAASISFDFNTSDMDATKTMQQRSASRHEIQEMETTAGEVYGGFCYFNPAWPLY